MEMKKPQLAFSSLLGYGGIGCRFGRFKEGTVEKIIGLLCKDGKIQEARNLVKKAMVFELRPSNSVLYDITCGYSE
ncbi:hypothetical protein ACFX2I_023551 [Malus domestica]